MKAIAKEARKTSRIEKFDGTDFAYWRMQIEDYHSLNSDMGGYDSNHLHTGKQLLLDEKIIKMKKA